MSTDFPEKENTDAALLERIKTGDEGAFSQLYDRLSPLLFGLVFKILNDAREAEDVVQEGFLLVWKKAATYDSARSSPSTWATMIFSTPLYPVCSAACALFLPAGQWYLRWIALGAQSCWPTG